MTLTLPAQRTDTSNEFDLDVQVVVAYASTAPGNCDTSDGCGNTCGGNNSSCNSNIALY